MHADVVTEVRVIHAASSSFRAGGDGLVYRRRPGPCHHSGKVRLTRRCLRVPQHVQHTLWASYAMCMTSP